MQPNRRGFIASVAAVLVARFAPKPKPTTRLFFNLPGELPTSWLQVAPGAWRPCKLGYTRVKIGDTIMIRKPPRYIVKASFDLEPWVEEREPFVIQNKHDLKLHGG